MVDLLEEHFEELDFLWEQRERVIFAWDWMPRDLAELEDRAEAHRDGLRIGAGAAVEIARPFLAGQERSAATAAAFTLLDAGGSASLEVLEASATAPAMARDGIRIALRHSDIRSVEDGLYDLGLGREPRSRALAADVLTFHRRPPPPEIERLLAEEDPMVRALAFGAAGRAGNILTACHVEAALGDSCHGVRASGLSASARCGVSELGALCRESAAGSHPIPEGVEFLGVVGTPRDVPLLGRLLWQPAYAVAAARAIGDLGCLDAIPALLEAMQAPPLAEAAAAAFTQITAIEVPHLRPAEPGSDDDDEPVTYRDAERAGATWKAARGRFAAGGRHHDGRDVSALGIVEALCSLSLRSRRAFYLSRRFLDAARVPDVELEQRLSPRPPQTSSKRPSR